MRGEMMNLPLMLHDEHGEKKDYPRITEPLTYFYFQWNVTKVGRFQWIKLHDDCVVLPRDENVALNKRKSMKDKNVEREERNRGRKLQLGKTYKLEKATLIVRTRVVSIKRNPKKTLNKKS